jgi:dienelactone hydrolase
VRGLSAALLATLLLTASSPHVSAHLVPVVMRDYGRGMGLDRYDPLPSRPAPVIVLVHGCCGDRRDMAELARALARSGAVVLNPDVRAFGRGGGWPATYDDVVCAVAAGRHAADELGDHVPVAAVAWSDGALVATAVTLGWSTFARRATGCLWPVPADGPDALVGISGHYGWIDDADLPVTSATIAWFGGTPSSVPSHWRLGNPGWWTSHVRAADVPPIVLIGSVADETTTAYAAALRDRGIDVQSYECGLGMPDALIHPRDVDGASAFDLMVEALHLSSPIPARSCRPGRR